ncbi:MAG: hypothetical protein Q9179_000209 [Wetmoreana sp. 5 TL-2023]
MSPEPMTLIDDDMDDLYADSPAVVSRQEESSTPPIAYSAPQCSVPNPQYNYAPLPGLGLSTRQWFNPKQDVNGYEKALYVNGRTEVTPSGGLQAAEPVRSPSQPADAQMPNPPESDQHLPGEQEEQDMQDGSLDVQKIQKETSARKHEEPDYAPFPQGEMFSATQPDTDHSRMDDTVAQGPDSEHPSKMQAYEQPSEQATSKRAQDAKGETSHNTNDVVASSNDMDISDPPQSEQVRDIEVPGAMENPGCEGPPVSSGQIKEIGVTGDKSEATSEGSAGTSKLNRAEDIEIYGDAGDKSKPVSKATKSVLAPNQPEQRNDTEAPVAELDQTLDEIAQADKTDYAAEFELDSSPYQSSSESESDSDSSSSSSGDSDYEMLDPEEEARRLMHEDGGSDEEGKPGKATAGPLRTLNEKPDEVVPKPQIEVTPAMILSELGSVEHVVENSILIKAKTSGESRALESGSLLCLRDRSVIGVIAETLGQVQQPYYSVRFTNPACIAEAGISKGTAIFYVEQHSTYVFTQNLKGLKGSDASNIHDEEVGDDELEFSDDEAEAEYKRKMKQERQARKCGRGGREDGFSKGPRGGRIGRGGQAHQPDARNIEPPAINYDDDDGEELYTPLARPTNLHEIMEHQAAMDPNKGDQIADEGEKTVAAVVEEEEAIEGEVIEGAAEDLIETLKTNVAKTISSNTNPMDCLLLSTSTNTQPSPLKITDINLRFLFFHGQSSTLPTNLPLHTTTSSKIINSKLTQPTIRMPRPTAHSNTSIQYRKLLFRAINTPRIKHPHPQSSYLPTSLLALISIPPFSLPRFHSHRYRNLGNNNKDITPFHKQEESEAQGVKKRSKLRKTG